MLGNKSALLGRNGQSEERERDAKEQRLREEREGDDRSRATSGIHARAPGAVLGETRSDGTTPLPKSPPVVPFLVCSACAAITCSSLPSFVVRPSLFPQCSPHLLQGRRVCEFVIPKFVQCWHWNKAVGTLEEKKVCLSCLEKRHECGSRERRARRLELSH